MPGIGGMGGIGVGNPSNAPEVIDSGEPVSFCNKFGAGPVIARPCGARYGPSLCAMGGSFATGADGGNGMLGSAFGTLNKARISSVSTNEL
jgi:hypothetical protein